MSTHVLQKDRVRPVLRSEKIWRRTRGKIEVNKEPRCQDLLY
jgi:hypothetical protein